MRKVVLLLCMVTSLLLAQTTIKENQRIQGFSGGLGRVSTGERSSHMWGIHDALFFLPMTADKRGAPLLAERFTVEDYIKEMNALYGNRANINIPLGSGFRYCTIKLRGQATTSQLEQLLIETRKIFNSTP